MGGARRKTWSDKTGNAPPLTAVDPVTAVSVTLPDLNYPPFGGEDFQTNLIMPEPCPFLSANSRHAPSSVPRRPRACHGVAFLTNMGLFKGQSPNFFKLLRHLAEDADESQAGTIRRSYRPLRRSHLLSHRCRVFRGCPELRVRIAL
jgi:hypothetical protein